MFQTIEIPLAGATYQDRSKPLTSQETRNFYQELVAHGKEDFVLKSFAGQALVSNAGITGIDRGMHQMLEVAYRVVGTKLFKIISDGTHSELGNIIGTERCIFADDGINLFIVSNYVVNHYSSSTGLLSVVTDSNIVGSQSVTFINNFFIYTKPLLSTVSNAGDGTTASGLNSIAEELNPDDLVRDYAFESIIYRFGTRSAVSWYVTGIGNPPIAKIEGQNFKIGLVAKHSIANSRNFLYFLGSDKQVYKARGSTAEPISTAAISGEIQGYDTVSDAFGEIITLDNKTFYVLTFPTEGKTWCLNEELDIHGWFQLSEGITDGRYNINSVLSVYGKTWMGDKDNGNLYELSFDSYSQHGETWRRRRVLSSVNGKSIGHVGKRVQMSRMELILETGVGLSSGQGVDPQIMLEASYDGGDRKSVV